MAMTPRRRCLAAAACAAVMCWYAAAAPRAQAGRRSFDVMTAGVQDIQDAVAAGALTYERLVELYLARIDAYDKKGPRLNAIIHVDRNALAVARELDAERRRSGLRSALHGIPIAIKDNVDVRDLPSAGGNIALGGTFPARDATIVTKLRAAGAIVFMKTNMDEFALGSQGLSTLGGQTLNVFDPRRSPGGSSGGTAVAVAAGFATLGIATETGLSTRGPASNAGLVGLVGTRGLVSRAGVIPISFTQDRVGVHARSVADAALLLQHLRGFDADDLQTAATLDAKLPDAYLPEPVPAAVGLRVGVLRELFPRDDQSAPGNALVDAALHRLRPNATLVDGLTTGLTLPSLVADLRVNNYEVRFAFDAYLERRGPASPIHSLAQLIASGRYLRSLDSRYDVAMKVTSLDTDQAYRQRLALQRQVRNALLGVMDREHVDALAYPVKALPAPPLGEAEAGGPRDNPFSSVAGLPAVVMPVGLHPDGLPIAIEFLGRPFAEATVLRVAATYERRGPARPLPGTTPHLPGDVFSYTTASGK